MQLLRAFFILTVAASGIGIACGGSDSASPSGSSGSSGGTSDAGPRGTELTGQECTVATTCYPGVAGADSGAIQGTVVCLDKVTNGYCTHLCTKDSDCPNNKDCGDQPAVCEI